MSRRRLTILWAGLGFAGSLLAAFAGADLLRGRPVDWWLTPGLPGGRSAQKLELIAGLVMLCLAWLGTGWKWRELGSPTVRELLFTGALWSLPLALGPALFSSDAYSYLAQGLIVHLGIDPYIHTPAILGPLGYHRLLRSVARFWRHSTAPYGPGFLALAALAATLAGAHIQLGVMLLRVPELVGLGLLAWFVPRLSRLMGGDPARGVWLVVISPVVLTQLVGAAHNDALMAGLLLAGVTLAVEGRVLGGIALCALAAAVKLPAAGAILFIVVAELRRAPEQRLRTIAGAAVVTAGAFLLVTAVSGLGFDWLSGSLISTPARVRLSITPATDIGWVVANALSDAGIGLKKTALEIAFGKWALVIPIALGVYLLAAKARPREFVGGLGLVLVALVASGPAAWPWYGIWGAALLGCLPVWQQRRWIIPVLCLPVFVIFADGQLRLPLDAAPWVLLVYVLAAGWLLVRGRSLRKISSPTGRTAVISGS